ncbi:MAG TPA: glycosyltransferase, partial [Xanthomonadales bacterium]|nr:glycosyltransferase [Xanthomonadales bacterium]
MNEVATSVPAIIIPVHNAAAALADCLQSVLLTVPPLAEVLILDDASDDPAVQPLIREYLGKAGPGWRMDQQTRNLGFVATVNRGMQMTTGNVVLLNSDTVVTQGWLEGLQRCLQSRPDIATATPWTNNGEIVSLPRFCASNPVPGQLDPIASVIARTGIPGYPEIPTAVGFCMAISRTAINVLGLFDEQLFGLGYGEENDFSVRAREAGFRNVLCDDVYVAHVGGCSFLPRGLAPGEASMQRLLSRHPGYLASVEAFIAADPLSNRREELLEA